MQNPNIWQLMRVSPTLDYQYVNDGEIYVRSKLNIFRYFDLPSTPSWCIANQASLLQPSVHKPTLPSISQASEQEAGVIPTPDVIPTQPSSSTSSANSGTTPQTKSADASGVKPAGAVSGKVFPPSARSRWKKLTGTAMFINRLGKPYFDNAFNRIIWRIRPVTYV